MELPTKSFPSVQFKNGSKLIALKDAADFSDSKIILKENSSSAGKALLENDRVFINAVFPSRMSAELAIISGECAGNASFCATPEAYLVLPEGGAIKAYRYGESTSEIVAKIDSEGRVSARVNHVVFGKDEFGSNVYGSLRLTPRKGFFDTRAKQYYVDLAGKHPSKFFDDQSARRELVRIIGLEKFREFRNAFDVGGEISFEKWRFLLVSGCMAHSCDDTSGVLVIDATNDDCWILRRKGSVFYTTGSRAIKRYEVELFEEVISGIELLEGHKLSVSSAGFLTLSTGAGSK